MTAFHCLLKQNIIDMKQRGRCSRDTNVQMYMEMQDLWTIFLELIISVKVLLNEILLMFTKKKVGHCRESRIQLLSYQSAEHWRQRSLFDSSKIMNGVLKDYFLADPVVIALLKFCFNSLNYIVVVSELTRSNCYLLTARVLHLTC